MTFPSGPITALRDVSGVIGSFVVDKDGKLLMKDLPMVFDDALFESVGPRLLRLGEALGRAGDRPETIAVRFAEHRLFVKYLKRGVVLATVSNLAVNSATLKMAVTLTARRLEQDLPTLRPGSPAEDPTGDRASTPPDTQRSLPVSGTRRVEATVEPVKPKARVLYRGRPI